LPENKCDPVDEGVATLDLREAAALQAHISLRVCLILILIAISLSFFFFSFFQNFKKNSEKKKEARCLA
jgi:hypothetical protein